MTSSGIKKRAHHGGVTYPQLGFVNLLGTSSVESGVDVVQIINKMCASLNCIKVLNLRTQMLRFRPGDLPLNASF